MVPAIMVALVFLALKGGVQPESNKSLPEKEAKLPFARMVTRPLSGSDSPPHPTFFVGAT
jgi:hypothetical protein